MPYNPNIPHQANNALSDIEAMRENFQELRRHEAGATEPSNPVAGMIWIDTGTATIKVRNTTNSAWLTIWDMAANKPTASSLVSADFGSAMKDAAANVASLRTLGYGATQAMPGDASLPAASGWQVFTSSGTFTVPARVTSVLVFMCGGGGGGGAGSFSDDAYFIGGDGAAGTLTGGGQIGGMPIGAIVSGLTPGAQISVTIGAGGAGAAAGTGNNGAAGTASSFGAYVTCPGGAGGTGNARVWGTSQPPAGAAGAPYGKGGGGGWSGGNGSAGACFIMW